MSYDLEAEVARLEEKLDATEKELAHLRTQLKSVEAERDGWKSKYDRACSITEALSTNDTKPLLLRLQEAEWLVQNLVATDTVAAARRDTFLNPKPQDVK